mmetsp:Transcript_41201/g.132656  ORF Transcript_41201/g.132656 Transcript_41201/m.132656 type:complete len:868 (+) Transcript_41201:82-2685(+)
MPKEEEEKADSSPEADEGDEDDYDPFAEEPAPHLAAAEASAGGAALQPKAAAVAPQGPALQPKAAGQALAPKAAAHGCLGKASSMPVGPPPGEANSKAPAMVVASGGHSKVGAIISVSKSSMPRSKSAGLVWDLAYAASAKAPAAVAAATPKAMSKYLGPPEGLDLPPGPPPGPAPDQVMLPPGPPPEPGVLMKAPPPKVFTHLDISAIGDFGGPLPARLPLPLPPTFLLPVGLPGLLLAGVAGAPQAASVVWEANMSPQGVPYYYCKATGESRWVRPCGPQDVVLDGATAVPGPPGPPAKASAAAIAAAAEARGGPEALKAALGEPESWESIGKTGWKRVETDKGFTYFFQKKKKITSWECPKEIANEVAELDGVLGFTGDSALAGDAGGGVNEEKKKTEESKADGEAAGDAAAEAAPAPEKRLSKAERAKISEREKEEEQKLSKEKQRLLNFKQLLIEKGVRSFDKYEKWLPKLVHDARFTAISNQAERKAVFAAYAKRIDADRQKEQAEKKRTGRDGFKELLQKAEEAGVLDGRIGPEAIRALERKYGEDPRWLGVKENEREKMISELAEDLAKKKKDEQDKARIGFQKLVLEKLRGKDKDPPPFHKMENVLRQDPRWAPVDCTSSRERIYGRVLRELEAARREKTRKQKRDLDEVDQIRKKNKLTQAEEALMNLFAERIKAPYATTWEVVVEALGNHPELRDCALERDEQERVFAEYRRSVTEIRCQEFAQLLAGSPADVVGPEMEFEEVLGSLEESTVKAFAGMPEDALQGAWAEWRDQAHAISVETARQWLRSCELLAGCEGIEADNTAFDALIEKLSAADVRFRRLAARPGEQAVLLAQRLREMKELRAQGRSGIEEDMD